MVIFNVSEQILGKTRQRFAMYPCYKHVSAGNGQLVTAAVPNQGWYHKTTMYTEWMVLPIIAYTIIRDVS